MVVAFFIESSDVISAVSHLPPPLLELAAATCIADRSIRWGGGGRDQHDAEEGANEAYHTSLMHDRLGGWHPPLSPCENPRTMNQQHIQSLGSARRLVLLNPGSVDQVIDAPVMGWTPIRSGTRL
jgi:hypothetical protein